MKMENVFEIEIKGYNSITDKKLVKITTTDEREIEIIRSEVGLYITCVDKEFDRAYFGDITNGIFKDGVKRIWDEEEETDILYIEISETALGY